MTTSHPNDEVYTSHHILVLLLLQVIHACMLMSERTSETLIVVTQLKIRNVCLLTSERDSMRGG